MCEKYLNNNLLEPKYLFHGSPLYLDEIEQRNSHDSSSNKENIDYAVFLTSSFIIASAYAFKDKIKKYSEDFDYNFEIGGNAKTGEIDINFTNVNIPQNLEGYIYVFNYNENYKHNNESSVQYKCHENIKPIDIVKIKFEDFKEYYNINNAIKGRKWFNKFDLIVINDNIKALLFRLII